MRLWSVFWIVVVAVIGTFAFVNWPVLTTPTTIDLVFAQVTAPLGITLLGAIVGLMLLFLVFLVWLETKALMGIGRAGRAQQAVEVPMAELRSDLDRAFSGLRADTSESMRGVIARLDGLERVVKDEIERTNQTLSSSLRRAS